ncbi:hypothetical protein Bbelb_440140 [Branchiostoma belcheri]|nr:hypothetical protein Bbelb_440140 [Branchiostoma belcheri]
MYRDYAAQVQVRASRYRMMRGEVSSKAHLFEGSRSFSRDVKEVGDPRSSRVSISVTVADMSQPIRGPSLKNKILSGGTTSQGADDKVKIFLESRPRARVRAGSHNKSWVRTLKVKRSVIRTSFPTFEHGLQRGSGL